MRSSGIPTHGGLARRERQKDAEKVENRGYGDIEEGKNHQQREIEGFTGHFKKVLVGTYCSMGVS